LVQAWGYPIAEIGEVLGYPPFGYIGYNSYIIGGLWVSPWRVIGGRV